MIFNRLVLFRGNELFHSHTHSFGTCREDGRTFFSSAIIDAFGNWLTFLAIALITQELYGAECVALVFLVQTLPAIILSRGLVKLVPEELLEYVYLITQVLLAIASLAFVFFQSLLAMLVILLVASVLKSLARPLFNSLVGTWTPPEKHQEVFTRIGGAQTAILATAPIVGAWLKITFSVNILFVVDAATFLIAVLLLPELFGKAIKPWAIAFQWKDVFSGALPRPDDIPVRAWKLLVCWFLFLGTGAILNAIEFPRFTLSGLNEGQIGYALAAWGVGALIAFLFPSRLSLHVNGILYVIALVVFVVLPGPTAAIVSFLLGGTFSSYFAGALRARLQQSVPPNKSAAPLWAYANQITQFINLIAYASAATLLDVFGLYAFGVLMVTVGVLMVAYNFSVKTEAAVVMPHHS